MYHTANTDPGMADALLDGINLANANLGTLDLTDAKLYGAVMSNANLINAKLNRAILTNASLDYSNIAGADFTDATLDHASLTNAAVSTKLNPNTSGVHLFSLPMSDSNFSGALAEVHAAATKQITLSTKLDKDNPDGDPKYQSYIDALNDGKFAPLCVVFQKMGVEFSQGATLATHISGVVWEIIDPAPPSLAGNYTIWQGYDSSGDYGLLARPSIPILQQLFTDKFAITLRWQATVLSGTNTDEWIVDNDNENPNNMQLGYMTFLVMHADGSLEFFGTTLRIEQLGKQDKLVIRIMTFGPTILCKTDADQKQQCCQDGSGSYLALDTICPNTKTLQVNQNEMNQMNQHEKKSMGADVVGTEVAQAAELRPEPVWGLPARRGRAGAAETHGENGRIAAMIPIKEALDVLFHHPELLTLDSANAQAIRALIKSQANPQFRDVWQYMSAHPMDDGTDPWATKVPINGAEAKWTERGRKHPAIDTRSTLDSRTRVTEYRE